MGNPHYTNLTIDENFSNSNVVPYQTESDSDSNLQDEEEEEVSVNTLRKKTSLSKNTEEDEIDNEESDENSDMDTDVIKKYQCQTFSSTCLVPENPEAMVIVNTTLEKILKKTSQASLQIYEVAPGEGKVPTNWLREENFDVKAFPIHHPSGQYGIHHERGHKLSSQQYFMQRLLNVDSRFSNDLSYLFIAQQYVERDQLERQINVSGQRGTYSHENGIKSLKLNDPFSVFQKIRGTPKYWQIARNELLAKLEQLGPFHFFFTLSCAEMRWSEVFTTILQQTGHNVKSEDDPEAEIFVDGIPLWEFLEVHKNLKQSLLQKHILTITRIFDHRVRTFIKHIVMKKGTAWLDVQYYSYRVEFQMRGMAHIHGVLWLHQHEIRNYMKHRSSEMDDDEYDRNKITHLIDKVITCSLTSEDHKVNEIVNEVQKHHHTKSCRKYNNNCRFGFPKLPSRKTIIATPLAKDLPEEERTLIIRTAQDCLLKIRKFLEQDNLDEDMTIEDMLQYSNISLDEYEQALAISSNGTTIVLKRSIAERFVNNYNMDWILSWNANIDLQFCYDTYAVVTYIADYYGKDETGMTELLQKALANSKNEGTQERLKRLKQTYLTHRQIGACEASYRLFRSMHLKDANVATIFLATGFPESRAIFFQKLSATDPEELNLSDSVGESEDLERVLLQSEEEVVLEGRQGKYKQAVTIQERYSKRPKCLDEMCLAQFAALYFPTKVCPKKMVMVDDASVRVGNICLIGNEMQLPQIIQLQPSEYGKMKLRSYPCVLRLHNSKKKASAQEYYYAELLLFHPWRNEETDLKRDNEQACLDMYLDNLEIITRNRLAIFPHSGKVHAWRKELDEMNIESLRPSHLYETLDSEGQQNDMDDDATTPILEENQVHLHPGEMRRYTTPASEDFLTKPIDVSNNDELQELARNLVDEQRRAFNAILALCRKIVINRQKKLPPPAAKHYIISGGAGVGKSTLIRAMAKWAEKTLQKAGDHPNKARVLLAAPTGMAASLIGGTTLFAAFKLEYGNEYHALQESKIDILRNCYQDLQVIIIDEMSMLSADFFYKIHLRLCEIFQSTDLFGGRTVVIVGDLMQLQPVKVVYIFEKPKCSKYWPSFNVESLWKQFEVISLTHNHRQGEGSEWSSTLNRIRINQQTQEDINILESRVLSQVNIEDDPRASHVFYTNVEVNMHNEKMLSSLKEKLYTIAAVYRCPQGITLKPQPSGTLENTPFQAQLLIKKYARIMLTFNINVLDGLTNGLIGEICDVYCNAQGQANCILDDFHNQEIGRHQREKHENILVKGKCPVTATPIFKSDFQFCLASKSGFIHSAAKCNVIQFPLKLAWAVTCHKMQGQTIKRGQKLIIHWHKKLQNNMGYVMLGRCEALSDLNIIGPFLKEKLFCHHGALAETLRINTKDENLLEN